MSDTTTRHVQIVIGLSNRVAGPATRVANSLWGIMRAAKGALFAFHAIGKTVGYFVRINQQIEDLNLSFAGIIKAKGLADSFTAAMSLSKTFVEEIRKQAGLLPGSLNQYVEIAKQSYSELSNAGFNTVQEQAKFIGQYGAVALTLQVPAAQAGRDLMHMLVGNVRTTTRTWALLKNEIGATVEGWDKMSAKDRTAAWLKLGTEGRRHAIQKALNQYSDMVKFAAGTWDAAWGAFGTHTQDIARMLSEDYFAGLKSALQGINETLSKNKEFVAGLLAATIKLTGALMILRVVSHRVNDKFGMGMMDFLRGRVDMKNPFAGFAAGTKMRSMWVRAPLEGPNVGYGSGGARERLRLGAGGQHTGIIPYSPDANWRWGHGRLGLPPGPSGGGGRQGRLPFGEEVPYANLMKTQVPVPLTILDRLKTGFPLLITAIGSFLKTTVFFVAAVAVIAGIRAMMFDIGGVTTMIADTWFRISAHFFGIWDALAPLMDGLGQVLPTAINGLLLAILGIVRAVSFLGKYAANFVDAARSGNFTSFSAGQVWEDVLRDEERRKFDADGLLKKKQQADAAATSRGSGPVYDFRGSRFTITQQFAEGFDPDRIAVAFADDLATLSNRRLQSSFSPVGAM